MSNLLHFPHNNLTDVPHMLRTIADLIEAGKFNATTILALVLDDEGELSLCEWGKPHNAREVAGILAEAGHVWQRDYVGAA